MLNNLAYQGQLTADSSTINHRYQILPSDFSRLYRQHYRKAYGIDVKISPEHNVDNWLNPQSVQFKKHIYDAVFHYHARTAAHERFQLSIATAEMKQAAWKYCHKKQLVLDGTFGLCTSRLLLWITLGVDESGHGVPVAMFLFSAPTGNRATHAGYDTIILTELLSDWQTWMGAKDGESFCPHVAIIDTDLKERGALLRVWPEIILLLCKFHVRQCWTNKRKSCLPRGESSWRTHLSNRFFALEESLLNTIEHGEALQIIERTREGCRFLALDREGKPYVEGVGKYLDYLVATWMPKDMWAGWSRFGRDKAARLLDVPLEGIIPTTNHLESLNGSLKRKYVPQWQHSGHRLRFDMLLYHLVSSIIPQIYAQRRMVTQYAAWKSQRFGAILSTSSSGSHSSRKGKAAAISDLATTTDPRLAWYMVDERRDADARAIFLSRRLETIPSSRPYELWARCRSMTDNSLVYWLTSHPTGSATCTCPDWLYRGGACKHMRAFRLLIEEWMQCGHLLPSSFHFAEDPEEATEIDARNRAWYGQLYDREVTSPLVETGPSRGTASQPSNLTASVRMDSPSSTELPAHMQSASTISEGDTTSAALSPPAHIQSTSLLQLEGARASELLQLTGDDSLLESASDTSNESETPAAADATDMSMHGLRAVELQLTDRLEHDISKVLPTLHGIVTYLKDPHSRTHVMLNAAHMSEFRGHI